MLCVPWLKALVVHAAVRTLPLPVSATALQPLSALPPSVKATLPVGLVPVTVAVKVTELPSGDGFNELPSAVLEGGGPAAAVPQASTRPGASSCTSALVTLMRMRLVVKAEKLTRA